MLSFQVPLTQAREECAEYALTASAPSPAADEAAPLSLKISVDKAKLVLSVDSQCCVTWKPLGRAAALSTAANTEPAQSEAHSSPARSAPHEEPSSAKGPPLSWELREFSSTGSLRPDVLKTSACGAAHPFKLMIVIDNYLRPHSKDGELSESSLSLEDRWADVFPRVISLGHDILADLAEAHTAAAAVSDARAFIAELSASVYERGRDWIEDLWVGERERYEAYVAACDRYPVDYLADFETAHKNATFHFALAAIESELAHCMLEIDRNDELPHCVLSAAFWIWNFDGPIEHFLAYVRNLAQSSSDDVEESMDGMRSQLLHLIRCRLIRVVLLEQPQWLCELSGSAIAHSLRARHLDFHCIYACHLGLADSSGAVELLRQVSVKAAQREAMSAADLGVILASYEPTALCPMYTPTISGSAGADLDQLWSECKSLNELATRFLQAACSN